MATATWSWSNSDGLTGVGSGFTQTLVNSGSCLGPDDYIVSITYRCRIKCSNYSSSYSWVLDSFSRSGSGSPYASYQSVTMTSNSQTFTGSMQFNVNDRTAFQSSSINFYIFAYNTRPDNGSSTDAKYISRLLEASVTVTYAAATLSAPTSFQITQNSSTGYYNTSWGASTLTPSNFGDIVYLLERKTNTGSWTEVSRVKGGLSINNLTPTEFNTNIEFRVSAWIAGTYNVTGKSNTVTIKFSPPALNTPALSLSHTSGDTTTISLSQNVVMSYGKTSNNTYSYQLQYQKENNSTWYDYNGGSGTLSFSSKPSIKLQENNFTQSPIQLSDGGKINFRFKLQATANTPTSYSATSYSTSGTFTYDGAYTVGVYMEGEWKECVVHYYHDGDWRLCIPHYYINGKFESIKTKTT